MIRAVIAAFLIGAGMGACGGALLPEPVETDEPCGPALVECRQRTLELDYALTETHGCVDCGPDCFVCWDKLKLCQETCDFSPPVRSP